MSSSDPRRFPPDAFLRGRWSCRSGRLNLAVAHLAFYLEMTVGLQANYPEKTVAARRADWRWSLGFRRTIRRRPLPPDGLTGDDRCSAGAEPPARGLYNGRGWWRGPPPHDSFACLAAPDTALCFLCSRLSRVRAFLLSACAFLRGCSRGGSLFHLRPYSPAHLLRSLSPPSWC